MDRTTIMLPDGLKSRISSKANEMHVSLGEFLRMAAETYLERSERHWTDDPLFNSDCVIREPSPSDVSGRVDEYLYGGPKRST
jgi:hypothetical protein